MSCGFDVIWIKETGIVDAE